MVRVDKFVLLLGKWFLKHADMFSTNLFSVLKSDLEIGSYVICIIKFIRKYVFGNK